MNVTTLMFSAVLVAATVVDAAEPVGYVFERVTRRVTLVSASGGELRAATGAKAHGGDRVRTGWLSHTILGAPRSGARFEIFAGSDVLLASDSPGVLVTLERGRLKAIFDKITGDEPRVVKTPGALLAVRGTRYGVEVDANGNAFLVVFEGAVEVRSPLQTEPLLVRAGEVCHYGRSFRPESRPASRGMNESRWQKHGAGADERMSRRDGGAHGGHDRGRDGAGAIGGTDRGRDGTMRPPGGWGRGH